MRASIAKQDLERQVDALTSAAILVERIYLDRNVRRNLDAPSLAVHGYGHATAAGITEVSGRLLRVDRRLGWENH